MNPTDRQSSLATGHNLLLSSILNVEEVDSDEGKGSVQSRHTQMTFFDLEQKNYCQEATIM